MTPTSWAPEEDRIALLKRDAGCSVAAISRALSRSERSVICRLLQLDEQQGKRKAAPKVRPCLCCGSKFTSAGPHNRLCLACRKKDVSPYQAV